MTKAYALYLESGPRMKTTMAHVFDLLGCIANGPTTEAALEAAPDEIGHYLRFLKKHGAGVDPRAEFKTKVAAHVMEGSWIGYGDPEPGFEPDFVPLTPKEVLTFRKRYQWVGEELVAIIRGLSARQLTTKPAKGRPIVDMIKHIAMAEPAYMQPSGIGRPDGTNAGIKAIEAASAGDLADVIEEFWALLDTQLGKITPEMRKAEHQRGQKRWTARRGFRRLLEHPWEHLRELQRRLA